MELDELYQEVILDHYKNPRCQRELAEPDAEFSLRNPLCGDQINLAVKVSAGVVTDISFAGHGCAISQASASLMTEICRGKSLSEVASLAQKFRAMMRGEHPGTELDELGDAVAMEGVRKYAARVKCATMAWEAVAKCLEDLCQATPKEQE